ncbi:ABC transporter substrate-binding protein [Gudongella oleilytica]|uniref:ABC transporter substrate-binding protein n=1 Tax=Gudongella oleilytica TaxID=1582259 RepID=UPI000FF88EC5|nr:ABC transporter substrate-binding protein [Gudongella oleilytica]
MKKVLVLMLAMVMAISMLAGCAPNEPAAPVETPAETPANDTPLVVGYAAFSQKFSPFFATTAYDMDAVTMTQVSLLTTDRVGGIVYNAIEGETVSYEGTDHEYTGIADIKVDYDEAADVTTYNIKLKEGVLFSDGQEMDADDIIFNYYVYSDPTYTGSTTFYSFPIIGMTNYRENNSKAEELAVTPEELAAAMENPTDEMKAFMSDFVSGVLTDELDWVKSIYGDPNYKTYTDQYPVAKDLFAFFYAKDANYDAAAVADEAQVLSDIIAQYGDDWKTLGANYGGSEGYFAGDIEGEVGRIVLKEKLAASDGTEVPNIEGIKKLGKYEVEVKSKGFDASAVYTICGIQVAPMHYYGSEDMYDYDNNKFGFTRGDLSGIEAKTTQPMGAGPYKFIEYKDKVVYYEANENYYKGAPKTKYVQLKETTDAEMIAGVGTGVIDLANPSGSKAKFDELKSYNSNGEVVGDKIAAVSVDNLGYGYIGINSKTVNVGGVQDSEASKNLRKGFATVFAVHRDVAIDSYYGDAASVINYPISNTSWAAPQKSDPGYSVAYSKDVDGNDIYTESMVAEDKYAAALEAAVGFFKAAGYTFDEATGKFTAAPAGAELEYEIIVPADGIGDHPAFAILADTKTSLEKIGITLTINDPADTNVLWDTLDANTHEMWTAAWGSTIDPDMYQVYHSSNGKGLGGTDSNSYNIADAELDRFIIEARKSPDQEFRKAVYKQALDIILDWGVEIPTYQRQNLVIFSPERINMDTVTPDITTYWGWMNDLELLEMK